MFSVGIAAWVKQIDQLSGKHQERNKKIFKHSIQLLKTRIMSYTPVGDPSLWHWPAKADYKPGFLRSNWKIDFTETTAKIFNDAPYAQRVEYNGWSTQAPDGMMRRGLLDYPKLLEQATKEIK